MRLIIAEKPELGKAIADALPGEKRSIRGSKGVSHIECGDTVVIWAYGHLFKLKEPEDYDESLKKWTKESLPIFFENWQIKPDEDKLEQIRCIGNLLKSAHEVIHAGDIDDEGQLLIDEILDYFKYSGPVKRMDTADFSKAYLQNALMNLKDNSNFRPIGRAAYARRVADLVVGVNYTRYFSCLNHTPLSVGRVQTPTLGLVVNRDMIIENHVKQKYYELTTDLAFDGYYPPTISAAYVPNKDDEILQDGMVRTQSALESVLRSIKGTTQKCTIQKKTEKEAPPLPFNMVKLQTYCGVRYGYAPQDLIDITQQLREKYKAITYNRSDCQYLGEEHYKQAPAVIAQVLSNLSLTLPEIDTARKSRCFNDANVTAHHAIIPTLTSVNVSQMSERERNVYRAICGQYIIQFMPDCIKEKTILTVPLAKKAKLSATSTVVLSAGFKACMKQLTPEAKPAPLSNIPMGEYSVTVQDGEVLEKETHPPERYTLQSLNEDMASVAKYVNDPEIKRLLLEKDKGKKGQNGSIGTTATRGEILNKLLTRGFLEQKGRSVISTAKGREFFGLLPDSVKKPDMTAKWWAIQEEIKEETASPQKLLHDVLSAFKEDAVKSYPTLKTSGNGTAARQPVGKCPRCGKDVVKGKTGFGCTAWKEDPPCKFFVRKTSPILEKSKKTLTATMMKTLLANNGTGKIHIKNLKSAKGKSYESDFVLEDTGTFVNLKMQFTPSK